MIVSARQAVARAEASLFGQPLVTNTVRGVLVEAMIAEALMPDWTWCAGDYASWDFEKSGRRLEVKQSAALQSWNRESRLSSTSSFDIAYRSQAWIEGAWLKGRARAADLYVFAHHPVISEEADHREPAQWQFYAVATNKLPETTRISLARVRKLTDAVPLTELRDAIEMAVAAPSPS